jgi:hypothetical protein
MSNATKKPAEPTVCPRELVRLAKIFPPAFEFARKLPDAIEADAKKKMSSFDGPSLEALESASA